MNFVLTSGLQGQQLKDLVANGRDTLTIHSLVYRPLLNGAPGKISVSRDTSVVCGTASLDAVDGRWTRGDSDLLMAAG